MTLLQKLAKDSKQRMEQAVEESYKITLKPWHKWISAAAFRVLPSSFFQSHYSIYLQEVSFSF